MPEDKEDKVIDIPTDGPGAEVTLPEEPVTEGAQIVDVPAEKPEGEVEVKDEPKKEEAPKELIQEEPKQETAKEETQEKELDEYGEGVKKRIAKLTKRMRESERQRDEATRYARTVLTEQKSLKERLAKLDTGYVSEMESRITSGLEAAKSRLSTARENSDLNAEVAAQKEIAKLGYEEARLAEMKLSQEANTQAVKEKSELNQQPTNIQQGQPQRPRPDAQATAWAQKNDWFGSDNAMTYTAFDLHKSLVEEEGYDPQSGDYYAELDRRIRLEFPHKFGNVTEQTTKPTQTVASATRNVKRGTGRKTVKLTSSQVAIAKKLNVPLEEYAKQLNVEE